MAVINLSAEPMDFTDVADKFRERAPLPKEQYDDLTREAKTRAFTIAEATRESIAEITLKRLAEAIEEGITMREFGQRLTADFKREGLTGPTPYRIDNIFRTNILTALSVGRYRQITEPAVVAARPWWEYDAVGDRRTRPSHDAQDGVIRRYDDSYWDTWYPPNGFRCRCGVNTLSEKQAQKAGGPTPEVKIDPTPPDAGFDYHPGKAAFGEKGK